MYKVGKNMKKSEKVIIVITLVCMAMLLLFATSYAYFSYDKKQDTANTYKAACYSIKYDETKDGVTIDHAFPMTDETAKSAIKDGKLEPYTLTMTNNCETDMTYKVIVNVLNTSTTDSNKIVLGYQTSENTEITPLTEISSKNLTTYTTASTSSTSETVKGSYEIASATLNPKQSITYKVYSWMSSTVEDNDQENTKFINKITVNVE